MILNIQSPAPVVQYEGVEYAANYHTVPRASSVRLLLPTENGYKCSRQPIKAQLDLRRSLKLQQPTSLSSAKDVGSREQSGHESRIDKEPLEVPKDLKMRWLPSGCRPIARESKASLPDKTVDTPRRHSSKKRKRLSGLQAVA